MDKRVTLFFVLFLLFLVKTFVMIATHRNIQFIVLDCFLTAIFYGVWCFSWGMKKGKEELIEKYCLSEELLDEIP